MSFRPVGVSTQIWWEKVDVDTGEAAMSTRLGSSRCSINFVPCSPFSCASLPGSRERGLHGVGALSEDLGTPHFKQEILVDESDSRSLKPDLLKITVLSFILKWVANYGLKKLKLELSRHIGPKCTHQKSGRTPVAAKSCSVLPCVEVNVSRNFVILSSLASSQPQLRLITLHKCMHHGFFLPAHYPAPHPEWGCCQGRGDAESCWKTSKPLGVSETILWG